MILCVKAEQTAIEKMIDDIHSEMQKTPFTGAVGIAYFNGDIFDSVCAKADAEMYKDKQRYKAEMVT